MGWETLRETVQENREARRQELAEPPKACPHCGTPLESGPNSTWHCPTGDYLWPRDGRLL